MTRKPTCTGRFKGPPKQAQIRLKDLANSFCCVSDPGILAMMDGAIEACLYEIYNRQNTDGHAELWTDGSYNEKNRSAGIGILINPITGQTPGETDQNRPVVFGKSVHAHDSQEAELYAMAVGMSYLLDTYPETKSVRLRYDCVGAAITAANIDAYADRGAPYTNFRNALKRARKAGVTILFQHVKSHVGNDRNEICDLLAKHYAKVPLNPAQKNRIAQYIKPGARTGAKKHTSYKE